MTVPISFEFFPPNTPVGDEKLKTVVRELGALRPEFFSVTYGAGGSTRDKTLATVTAIAAAGFEAAPHLSCVGSTRQNIAETLDTYRAQNIRRIVALRGDLPSGTATAGEFRYAADLVSFIREAQGADWHVEVAAYPEYHPAQRYAARESAALRRQGQGRRERGDHAVPSSTPTPTSTSSRTRAGSARTCRSCRASCRSTTSRRSRSSRSATASRFRAGSP